MSVESTSSVQVGVHKQNESSNPVVVAYRRWSALGLTLRTAIGAVVGILIGVLVQAYASPSDDWLNVVGFIGEIYVRALRLLVLPYIALSMLTSPSKVGDASLTKRMGGYVVSYYAVTSLLGVTEALIWVNIFRPGERYTGGAVAGELEDGETYGTDSKTIVEAVLDIGRTAVANNLFGAFVNSNILGILVFSLWLGFVLMKQREHNEHIRYFVGIMEGLTESLMGMLQFVIDFTPIAVLSLLASHLADQGVDVSLLGSYGFYFLNLMFALVFHVTVTYSVVYFLVARKNPLHILKNLAHPIATAFATSSSAATIPVTMKTAIEKNNVNEEVALFVIPLGATVNMDAACIKYTTAVIFIASLSGVPLNFGQQVVLALISATVSMGASPLPSAGVVFIVLVMDAVGVPINGFVVTLLAIEWLSDRFETVGNVMGDCVGAVVVNEIMARKEKGRFAHTKLSRSSSDGNDLEAGSDNGSDKKDVILETEDSVSLSDSAAADNKVELAPVASSENAKDTSV